MAAAPLPFWKKWASYLVDIPLGRASTDVNPHLELCLRKGRFYLTAQHAVYSYADLYDNFSQSFHLLNLDRYQIKDVLMLGFGMGSVPFMLETVFKQKYRYVGIEADATISDWAHQYLLPSLSSPILLLQEDALDYMERTPHTFDMVIVDLFVDTLVPLQFESIDFLENLHKALNNNGLLLFNRLSDTDDSLRFTERFFNKKFSQVFPGAYYLDVKGNWMLVWQKPA